MTRVLDGSLLARSQVRRGGGGERAWFQPFAHVPNCDGIPLLPHTIDILLYTFTCYTVRRLTIAAYSV